MQELVNVYIRPHLIPFLFQELEGDKEAVYEQKKVKLAKATNGSVLGQLIHVFKHRADKIKPSVKIKGFSVFISFDSENETETKATISERTWNQYHHLQLQEEDVKLLNDLLESIFRLSFIQFVKGYIKNTDSVDFVNKAIHEFMLAHHLYEVDVDPESLRRFYYYNVDPVKKNHLLRRIQVPIGNQSKYFATA